MSTSFTIRPGFDETDRKDVAHLFWTAFSAKLMRVLGPDAKGEAFFARIMDPDFALSAYDESGRLLGVAGFKTAKGALTDGDFKDIVAIFGWFGATWRLAPLMLLEREIAKDILLMDGIFVAEHARSKGVGAALLQAVCDEAKARNCRAVRLDVIDTNPRARALYERVGFQAHEKHDLGPFKWLFGFSYATTMTRSI